MALSLSQELDKLIKTAPKISGVYKCLSCGEEFIKIVELPSGLSTRSIYVKLITDNINFDIRANETVYCNIDGDSVSYSTGLKLTLIHTCSDNPYGIASLTRFSQKDCKG